MEVSLNHFEVHCQRYVMGLITDITLRRKAEEELQRSNDELEDRVEQRTAELREAENNLLLVEGSVPGGPNSVVVIRKAIAAKPIRVAQAGPAKKKGKK